MSDKEPTKKEKAELQNQMNMLGLNKTSDPNVLKLQDALTKHKAMMPLLTEHIQLEARMRYMKFEQLKKEGFSDQQALELVKVWR